jgi:patatin-related protein
MGQTAVYDPVREVRFAVVIYGGVSLAIYINGIVQEMLAMVRATAPATGAKNESAPLIGEAQDLRGTEKVYRKLGQLLDESRANGHLGDRWEQLREQDPIRTRFVIDVLSGTSAGGINAMFLAKALAINSPLKPLQQLWQQEGDIAKLINDRRSLQGRPLQRQRPPRSLLNSQRMYYELLGALDHMDDTASTAPSPLVETLDLFSTTTDINGLQLQVTLADKVVHERRHRNKFCFRHIAKGPGARSDFRSEDNPFLAYAARCTSAFPFAFEPMALCDIFPALRASARHRDKAYCDPDTQHWRRHYLEYVDARQRGGASLPFQLRSFGDGGYLDNKPFSYAIDALLKRHADLPVDRKLVYIEPSPEKLRGDAFGDTRPDALENSFAALLTLPRYETIRQDLEVVVDRNVEVERVNRVLRDVGSFLQGPESGGAPEQWCQSKANEWGPGYTTYERLKITSVTDDLADLLAAQFGIDTRSASGTAARVVANAWRDLAYPDTPMTRFFLLHFDVAYRLRRIRHVWRAINAAHAEPRVSAEFRTKYLEELRQIKNALEAPYLELQYKLEQPGLDPRLTSTPMLTAQEMAFVVEPPIDLAPWEGLGEYPHVKERSDRGAYQRAKYLLQRREKMKDLSKLGDALRTQFEGVLKKASDIAHAAFADSSALSDGPRMARQLARDAYKGFDRYDSAVFPITFGTNVGECDLIELHRISPDDARRIEETAGRPLKVYGQSLGAFGAFLDRNWRKNDILVGRLHGAERLITMLLPGQDPATRRVRDALVDEAHREIVIDFFELPESRRAEWLTHLRQFVDTVKQQPEPQLVARSATRASAVTGEMLEAISDARRAPGKVFFGRAALIARFLFLFVEISVPHSIGELFGRYWLQLFLLFAVMLLVASIFGAPTATLGLYTLAAAIFAFVARQFLRKYLHGRLELAPATAMLLTVAMVAGSAFVVQRLPAWWRPLEAELVTLNSRILQSSYGGASLEDWVRSLAVGSLLVVAISGLVLAHAVRQIPQAARDSMRTLRRLQLARTQRDVSHAVGEFDLSMREAASQAVRADNGLAAAYAMFLSAIGMLFVLDGRWPGWIVTASGAAAGIADLLENQAVLAILAGPSDCTDDPLDTPPHQYAVAKWSLLAVSILTWVFLMVT